MFILREKIYKIPCTILYFLLRILFVSGQTYTSVINIASGPIRGLISTTIENVNYASFKGIPYAKPPLGNLRFRPPVSVDPWTSVYNATTEANICIQVSFDGKSIPGSEDCLYINVYTPHTQFNGSISKPVMVWIHGGGYNIGDSRQSSYGPDYILGEDVVFVSLNYRLSALGFLNLDHENATGNCALKDQSLALKWTKQNIAKFGGNPDKITMFGQSAGASAADLQVLSDMSTGLFSQSISMSGSTLGLWWGLQRREEALQQAFLLGSRLGTNTRNKDVLLAALYSASAVDLVTAARAIGLMPFRPTVENPNTAPNQEKFLSTCSPTKYVNGNYTKGPHMMGFTSDETLAVFRGIDSIFDVAEAALNALQNATRNIPVISAFIASLTNAIINGLDNFTDEAVDQLETRISDLLFVLGIDTKQKFISQNNNYPVYYYRFSFVPSKNQSGIELEGAAHADDLPYIFYQPSVQLPSGQADVVATRQRMVKLYTNFAKYGNPTPDGSLGIIWPDSRPTGVHLEIGKNLATGPRPTSNFVKTLQLFGLGSSPYLNDCSNN